MHEWQDAEAAVRQLLARAGRVGPLEAQNAALRAHTLTQDTCVDALVSLAERAIEAAGEPPALRDELEALVAAAKAGAGARAAAEAAEAEEAAAARHPLAAAEGSSCAQLSRRAFWRSRVAVCRVVPRSHCMSSSLKNRVVLKLSAAGPARGGRRWRWHRRWLPAAAAGGGALQPDAG